MQLESKKKLKLLCFSVKHKCKSFYLVSQCTFAKHVHGRIRSIQTIDTIHSNDTRLPCEFPLIFRKVLVKIGSFDAAFRHLVQSTHQVFFVPKFSLLMMIY